MKHPMTFEDGDPKSKTDMKWVIKKWSYYRYYVSVIAILRYIAYFMTNFRFIHSYLSKFISEENSFVQFYINNVHIIGVTSKYNKSLQMYMYPDFLCLLIAVINTELLKAIKIFYKISDQFIYDQHLLNQADEVGENADESSKAAFM